MPASISKGRYRSAFWYPSMTTISFGTYTPKSFHQLLIHNWRWWKYGWRVRRHINGHVSHVESPGNSEQNFKWTTTDRDITSASVRRRPPCRKFTWHEMQSQCIEFVIRQVMKLTKIPSRSLERYSWLLLSCHGNAEATQVQCFGVQDSSKKVALLVGFGYQSLRSVIARQLFWWCVNL